MDEVNKATWKLKSSIIRTIVNSGGIVFGGAVRDSYIHDTNASNYYKCVSRSSAGNMDRYWDRYCDPTHHPEYAGRMQAINDIDMSIHESRVDALCKAIELVHNVSMTCTARRDPAAYNRMLCVRKGEVQLQCWKINLVPSMSNLRIQFAKQLAHIHCVQELITKFVLDLSCLQLAPIYIDMLVIKKPADQPFPEPPFNNLDFECNGLIMDTHGLRLSAYVRPDIKQPFKRHELLVKVLEDILEKKAVCCTPIRHRVTKMLKHDWSICSRSQMQGVRDAAYEGRCIICHDSVPTQHYKLVCCDARYHAKCLLQSLCLGMSCVALTNSCIMCRAYIHPNFVNADTDLITIIVEAENSTRLQGLPSETYNGDQDDDDDDDDTDTDYTDESETLSIQDVD